MVQKRITPLGVYLRILGAVLLALDETETRGTVVCCQSGLAKQARLHRPRRRYRLGELATPPRYVIPCPPLCADGLWSG